MIIKLENMTQDLASQEINWLYEQAISGRVSARNILKKVYGDSWNTIKEKMESEGSIWYVWYMDGVNTYIQEYYK